MLLKGWEMFGLGLVKLVMISICEGAGFVGGPIYPIIFATGAMGSALGASSWVSVLGGQYVYICTAAAMSTGLAALLHTQVFGILIVMELQANIPHGSVSSQTIALMTAVYSFYLWPGPFRWVSEFTVDFLGKSREKLEKVRVSSKSHENWRRLKRLKLDQTKITFYAFDAFSSLQEVVGPNDVQCLPKVSATPRLTRNYVTWHSRPNLDHIRYIWAHFVPLLGCIIQKRGHKLLAHCVGGVFFSK